MIQLILDIQYVERAFQARGGHLQSRIILTCLPGRPPPMGLSVSGVRACPELVVGRSRAFVDGAWFFLASVAVDSSRVCSLWFSLVPAHFWGLDSGSHLYGFDLPLVEGHLCRCCLVVSSLFVFPSCGVALHIAAAEDQLEQLQTLEHLPYNRLDLSRRCHS